MDYLRFGAVGLSAAEDALIATLFRLHRVDRSFIWTLVTAAPYDALLIDVRCGNDAFEHLLSPSTKTQRLGDIDSEQPGELPRPIRSDLLVRWLNSIEIEILHGSRDPFASTTMESRLGPSSQGPRSRLPVSTPAPTSSPTPASAPRPVAAARLAELAPHARWKLRRWPGHALLGADVNRIRMATMLTRRPLSVQDLSAATGVTEIQCEQFVGALHLAGLIDAAAPTPAQPTPAAAAAPTARGIGRSLLRSIRQRFGL